MLLSTTHTVPGREITQLLGLVRGSTARAKNIGKDFLAGLRNIVGGEVTEYTRLQAESREQALQRMINEAQQLGADAVIGIYMTTSMIDAGVSEIMIYGTAVKLS